MRSDLGCLVVILPLGGHASDVETRIKETAGALAAAAERLMFVVVEDANNDNASIAEGVDATIATLGEAISFAADQDAVYGAVVDSGVRFDQENWSGLLRSAKGTAIACSYQLRQRKGKWYAVAFDGVASFVSRLLLRTGKQCDRIGVTVFELAQIKPLLDDEPVVDAVENLIAVCKSEKVSVFEAALDTATSCGDDSVGTSEVTLRSTVGRLAGHVRCWWSEIAFPVPLRSNFEVRQDSDADVEPDVWTAQTKWLASTVLGLLAAILLFSNLGYPLLALDYNPQNLLNLQQP